MALLLLAIATRVPAQQRDSVIARAAQPTSVQTAEYQMLRRLLGVSPPTTVPDQPVKEQQAAPVEPPPAEAPAAKPSAAAPAPQVEAKPDKPAAAPKPAQPSRKAVKDASPGGKAKAKPTLPSPPAKSTQKPATAAPEPAPASTATAAPRTQRSAQDAPAPGTVLAAADIDRWKQLMGPSVQWAVKRGATLRVAAPKSIPMEAARAFATERYHDRVELTADKTDMKNWVAGIPFPSVSPSDPDAGIKVMLNQQSRISSDDLDVHNIACDGARIVDDRGMTVEKRYVTEHWRRLSYVGRLYKEPKPTWSTLDGVRYRESQYPFIEPVDIKGGGWTYTRYLDPARLDDVWVYNPAVGRVRRMSTAQRSQGMFGQDMDIDSISGFAANPAWTQWRLLGVKTVLAPMHADRAPVQWQKPPSDFFVDEGWEPREVYVIVGRSRLPEYGSADRVIYVDRESSLVAYSEIYDMKGQLWRALIPVWNFGSEVRPDLGGSPIEEVYLPAYTMLDIEIAHVTRCELPSDQAAGGKGWYYNYGAAQGVTPQSFDVSNFAPQAR